MRLAGRSSSHSGHRGHYAITADTRPGPRRVRRAGPVPLTTAANRQQSGPGTLDLQQRNSVLATCQSLPIAHQTGRRVAAAPHSSPGSGHSRPSSPHRTAQRLGRMLDSAYSVRSTRLSRTCPHGYLRPSLVTIWRRFGMATDSAQSARGSVLSAFPVDGTPDPELGPVERG